MDIENNIEFEPVNDFDMDKTPPGPLKPRICPCGCEKEFQPRRRDQIYYNSQHANYAYNHGKRKEKNKNRSIEEKALRKNDDILDLHFKMDQIDNVAECFLKILISQGFRSRYHIGMTEKFDKVYYFLYRYNFYLFKDENNLDKIKIYKR